MPVRIFSDGSAAKVEVKANEWLGSLGGGYRITNI